MQFRGHSLLVHHSVVYHGKFFFFSSSHFISQFPPTRFPLITVTRMCHFLPVHHLEWHFWPGQKVKTQQLITDDPRNFAWALITSMIRKGQIGLELWIPKLAIESSTQRVSGKFDISQFSGVCQFPDLSNNIRNYRIVPYDPKILQNF